MGERRHPRVINIDEIEAKKFEAGTKFGSTMKPLGFSTGAQKLGCTHYEVEPGRTAFPFHYHCANEEVVFILEGSGVMRIGKDRVEVRAGDYVTFNIGPDNAHQLLNTGNTPLRYLCFSTLGTAEVVGYPDSKKIGALAAPSSDAAKRGEHWIRSLAHEPSNVGYYDGEDVG